MSDIDPLAPTAVASGGSPPLLAETFDGDRVTEIRHAVAGCVEAAGLDGPRLDDFVLAINELMTNAVRHGGGRGWLRLWRTGAVLHCLVSDTGAGIGADRLDDRRRPLPEIAGGWGLWLARQLSDEMLIRSGPEGTTVRISANLSTAGPAPPTG
ncbi:ATP-binding protein [Micromonosporaceae bacterium B7E4]